MQSNDEQKSNSVPAGAGPLMAGHTLLPWRAQDNGVFYYGAGWRELIASTSTERDQWRANAAFIAQACNNYRDLVWALREAIRIADEASEEWDKAPEGMRAGKLLIALSGRLKGYRADIDVIHATLAKAEA